MATEKRHTNNHLMIERMSRIHSKIKTNCYPNTKQLAFDNDVSLSTISRDIEYLRDRFGAPIQYDASHRGYFYTQEYEMPLNLIPSQDLLVLSLMKQLMVQYEGSPVYNEIASVIDLFVDPEGIGKSDFLNRVAVPPLPKVKVNKEAWDIIVECLKENTIIEFDYNGRWRTSTTHRKVHPYQVLLQDGIYFVFGFDENADEGEGGERLFNLSRMKNIKNTKQTFELPDDFEFASRCGGGRFGAFKEADTFRFEIDFYGEARQFVKDSIWAGDQVITDIDDEDTTKIKFTTSQSIKVMEWLLSQGKNALPIEPAWFVDQWKEQVRAMAKML